jgi:hypothetical protein
LASETYGKNKENISEVFLQGFHNTNTTGYELKETSFEEAYSKSDIKDRNSQKLTDVIEKDNGFDPMGKTKREEYEAMHTALENALGEDD